MNLTKQKTKMKKKMSEAKMLESPQDLKVRMKKKLENVEETVRKYCKAKKDLDFLCTAKIDDFIGCMECL